MNNDIKHVKADEIKSSCCSNEKAEVLRDRYKRITREDILKEATSIVMGDRADSYGELEDNFNIIAEYWNTYINSKKKWRPKLDGEDVSNMMTLLKLARIGTGKYKNDSYVDLAGYAACAGELARLRLKKGKELNE